MTATEDGTYEIPGLEPNTTYTQRRTFEVIQIGTTIAVLSIVEATTAKLPWLALTLSRSSRRTLQ
ncbi:MAG: hypothetical protein ACNYNY_00705 [Candidatus Oxydemutatoraceae bacterium WSBS_2016_MAG_OTU14]